MKKALSILLTLTMLATLCTVPAWAEDATLDLPVIEEVTEEELTEVDLFGEEIELMADEDFAAIETSETDGITLLSEIDGVDVSFQNVTGKGSEGAIASLYNGQITVGDDLGGQFIKDGDVEEGYMIFKGDTITIDFGEKMAFSGIRLWDSSRTRYFGTYGTDGTGNEPRPGARRIVTSTVYFSDDGENWYRTFPAAAVYNEEGLYSDLLFPMNGKGAKINLNARYIKFEATTVTETWGELEMEEIAMIDANSDLKTWSLDGHEIPNSAIESVVAGSEWNTISYKVSNAYDGMISLSSYWHSFADPSNQYPDRVYTDEDRSFVITLKEKTKIGGIRLWPRNDATAEANAKSTATMRKVRLMGSEDGTNWYNITSVTADLHNTYDANGYMMPVDVIIPSFIDADLKYIKVVGEKVDNYVCLAEFQLLDEGAKTGTVSAYLSDDDVVTWKAVPAQTAFYSSLGKSIAVNTSVFDGQVHQVINEGEGYYATWLTANNDPHWEIDNALTGDGYVTVDFDLGKSYTFSGARIFGRWNQPGQALTKGHIWVSDDGETWYKSDLHEDGGTTVNIAFEGGAIERVALAKYASTGEIYTDIPATFGEDYNITARYIRIHCAETGGGNHWSFQELLLTAPDNANPTKTPTELGVILKAEADEVTAVINALSASSAIADIEAARSAYEALPEGAKELVTEETLNKLADAEALVKGSIYEMSVAQSTGLNKATFTLPVRDNMEIKSVTYTDTLGRVIDGTDAASVTNDGTNMTITLAGGYETATGLTAYTDGSKGTLYFGTANTTYGWTAGQEIQPSFFTGSFVRKVTSDGIGNHYITITFGDDSTATVNIKTTADFIQLTSAAAIEGSEYDDEIAPKTTWKATTTIRNRDMNKAFDGQVEYLIRKGGATTANNRYETDFVAGKYTANADLSGAVEQVLLYPPVRLDFILDTGEETEISGIRIYPRVSSYKEDKTAGSAAGAPTQIRYWGSDDGEDWVSLGDYTFTTNLTEKTAKFSDIVSYRYYKGSVTKSNGLEYKQTISISEITLLKADTMLTSDEVVTVDASENKAAEFTFALVDDETVASLKDADGSDVAYTFADGVLAISKDTVATLANGENVFTVTFTNDAEFTLTVNKTDTSKVTYMLFDASNGTGALVLTNTSAKEVTALELEDGTELEFTQSDDNKEITVIRQYFRRSGDFFSLIDVNKGGEVKVVATFSDSTTKTYTVTVDAAWVAVTGTSGEFADDEIIPDTTKWKARVSSALDVNQPSNVLSAKAIGKKDYQNWHSYHSTVNGVGGTGDSTAAIGHYLDVDFGENVTPYTGIRHLERPGGTTWNTLVTVTGKNSADEEWTEVYSAKPYYEKVGDYTVGENSVPIYSSDILFGKAVSYRYLRIHIVSTSNHITADTIHFIKDKVTFTGPEKVVIDKDNVTDAKFTFHVPADAEGIINVKVADAAVDAANYTWDVDAGALTLKADYLKTLGTGSFEVKVQIDSSEYFEMDVELKDYYSETYYLTETDNARGTDNLVITIPEGKTLSTLKYGDKDVAFTQADGKATVLRYNFRGLDNFFEVDSVTLNATFSDTETATYTINLQTEWLEVPEADETLFLDDEIVPDMWSATTLSTNSDNNVVSSIFSKTGTYWHSAYTEDRSDPDNVKAVADSEEGRHYIMLSTDSGVTFSGIRYYSRTDNLAGTWDGVTVYVKELDDEEWTLVKSQNFDKTTLGETRVATVYFDEPVYADDVLIVADAGYFKYATAKALTLLKEGASAPGAEEDEVKIDVTPTTGGNVYIDGVPSLGSANVAANDSITLTADEALFKYWIEANTGKILGTDATTGITIKTSVGKDIRAIFADPSAFEAFYAFIGRDGAKLVSSGYVKKGTAPVAPSADQLYTTGYSFVKWVNKDGGDVDVTAKINAETEYYALYEAKGTKQSTITVTNGTVGLFDETDEAASEKTYAYDTKVKAVAAEAEEGQKFAYWTIDEKIVCYTETYIFFAPDMDVALTAVYVAEDAVVEKAVGITMTVSQDTVANEDETILVASFLTTRVVPEGVTVLETGVIYVKDDGVTDLTIDMIGTTTADGKKIKVALCDSKTSGQYKLTASYKDYGGISARGFITYLDGEEVKTVYTDFYKIDCSDN